MMFRMSTLSRLTRGAVGFSRNDCRRNRNARPKISPPRRATREAAARADPVLAAFAVADNTTPTPARKRKLGAPNPPTIIAHAYTRPD
ncbi:MAG: hypothetical protein HYS05_15570 [Acidobacteria bacterium]|nr:hypothetical protein [Acidobacteriota bacterium]